MSGGPRARTGSGESISKLLCNTVCKRIGDVDVPAILRRLAVGGWRSAVVFVGNIRIDIDVGNGMEPRVTHLLATNAPLIALSVSLSNHAAERNCRGSTSMDEYESNPPSPTSTVMRSVASG